MYCKNCGKEIDDNAVYCRFCGVAVNDNRANGNFNTYNTNSYAPYQKPKREYNFLAIMGLIFSVIGFGTIVMGIAGLICSIIGFKHSSKINAGKTIAIVGIVLAIVAIIVQILIIVSGFTGTDTVINGGLYY